MTFRSSIPGFLCAFFGPSMQTCATCLILLLLYPSFVELKKTKQNNKLEELQEDLKSLKETSTGWYKVGLSPTWFSFRDFMWSTCLCLQLVILVLMLVSQECVRSPIVLLVPPSVAAFCGHETYPWCRSDAEEQPLTCLFFLSFTWWIPTYSNWDRTMGESSFSGILQIPSHSLSSLLLQNLTALKMFFHHFVCITDLHSPLTSYMWVVVQTHHLLPLLWWDFHQQCAGFSTFALPHSPSSIHWISFKGILVSDRRKICPFCLSRALPHHL